MSQNDNVLLRQESANLFLWDKIFYIKKSGRYALNFALEHLGITEKDPSVLRQHLPEIFTAVKDGHQTAQKHTVLLLDIYRDGVKKDDLEWAETEIQRRLLGKYIKKP